MTKPTTPKKPKPAPKPSNKTLQALSGGGGNTNPTQPKKPTVA